MRSRERAGREGLIAEYMVRVEMGDINTGDAFAGQLLGDGRELFSVAARWARIDDDGAGGRVENGDVGDGAAILERYGFVDSGYHPSAIGDFNGLD